MQQIMGTAPLAEQQGEIDRQLQDVLARRRAYQPAQHTTGIGALLGGIGDIIQGRNFNDQEQALRAQRSDLARQIAGSRSAYANAFSDANQPVQAPPEMIAAPGVTQQSLDAERQQKLSRLQTAGMLSGDPLISNYLQKAPQMAQEQQTLEQGAQRFPLQQAMDRLKLAQAGPQADLGGKTPGTFELLTKRMEAPKFTGLSPGSGVVNTRTGEVTTPAGEDRATMRERKKARAALNIGPDLEPNEDLVNKVLAGEADPGSPGMKAPLEKLGKLNSAAAGFSDVAQRLKDFLAKHPNGSFAGTDATEAEAIAQDLRSLYMENLNMQTLRANDIPILNKVIADPTTLLNMAKSSTGVLDLGKQLDTAVNLSKQRALSQAEAIGYGPSKSGRYAGFQGRRDQASGGERQILKWQQNTSTGKKRPVYSDGSYGPEQPL